MSSLRPARFGVLLLATTLLAISSPLPAGAAAPPVTALHASVAPVEITATAAGRAVAAAAQARFAALAPGHAQPRLGVWTDAAGVLVAPLGIPLAARPWRSASGTVGTVLVPLTAAVHAPPAVTTTRPATPGGAIRAATAPAWTWLAQGCFSRSSDVWSWLDHCYQLYAWSSSDGWDYWQLLRYGTAGANWPWALHDAFIGSYATPASAVQQWVQWDPLGDETGPCQVVTVHISSPAVGISWPVQRCDTWAVDKGLAGGSYALTWRGPGTHGQRGLAYVLATRVPHGAFAQWALPGGSDGNVF